MQIQWNDENGIISVAICVQTETDRESLIEIIIDQASLPLRGDPEFRKTWGEETLRAIEVSEAAGRTQEAEHLRKSLLADEQDTAAQVQGAVNRSELAQLEAARIGILQQMKARLNCTPEYCLSLKDYQVLVFAELLGAWMRSKGWTGNAAKTEQDTENNDTDGGRDPMQSELRQMRSILERFFKQAGRKGYEIRNRAKAKALAKVRAREMRR